MAHLHLHLLHRAPDSYVRSVRLNRNIFQKQYLHLKILCCMIPLSLACGYMTWLAPKSGARIPAKWSKLEELLNMERLYGREEEKQWLDMSEQSLLGLCHLSWSKIQSHTITDYCLSVKSINSFTTERVRGGGDSGDECFEKKKILLTTESWSSYYAPPGRPFAFSPSLFVPARKCVNLSTDFHSWAYRAIKNHCKFQWERSSICTPHSPNPGTQKRFQEVA